MHIVSRVGIGKIPPSSPLFLDVGGAVNFDNTLRVIGQTTVNSLISSQLDTNTLAYEIRVPSDVNVLFSINRDGTFEWGAGGLNAPDTNLYRSDINTLRTNASFVIDNSLIVGSSEVDTATFTARIASNFDPSATNLYNLGQSALRWQNLWLSSKLTSLDGLFTGDLQVDGNTILGDTNADTLAVNARVSTSVIPSADNSSNLGSLLQRWASLWLGSNLQVDGNTILGDSPSDTVTINAGFASPINPSVDNFYDFGTFDYRWKQIHLGPSGFILHDDVTNTKKASFFISSSVATLTTDSATSIKIATDGNNGIVQDVSGKVGINTFDALLQNFSVNGTSSFSDTLFSTKSFGIGIDVTSILAVKGSIESSNTEKTLNIGTTDTTRTINIGSGIDQTIINIGGPSDIVNISGTVMSSSAIESIVKDKTLTLNIGNSYNTAQNSGIVISEADPTLLSPFSPQWQANNTIRYSCSDTGQIEIGSIITISGFLNPENNGQFTVVNITPNSFFDIENSLITDGTKDEPSIGSCTNPVLVAKFLVSNDRSGWSFYSPLNQNNYFKIGNTGANVELNATTTGISVVSNGFYPNTTGTNLGSVSNLWDGFLNNLNVYGDSIIGNASTDTIIINSTTSFVGNIDSDIIPNASKNLGSMTDQWLNLYASNIRSSSLLQATGTINLGTDAGTTISALGLFSTDLIPNNSSRNLGSPTTPWNQLFVNTIAFPTLNEGSVIYLDSSKRLSGDSTSFFWDFSNKRLFLGQNTGNYILDIKNTSSDAIRIRNSDNSSSIALRTSQTVYSFAQVVSNTPETSGAATVSFSLPISSFAQIFDITSSVLLGKIGLQLSLTTPPLGYVNDSMTIGVYSVSGGLPDTPIAFSNPVSLASLSGFQNSYTEFTFTNYPTLAAGTYALVISIENQSDVNVDTYVSIVTESSNPYTNAVLKQYDSSTSTYSTVSGQNVSFTLYNATDTGLPIPNKIEFTNAIQFGVNTYASVGSGTSTAVLELTSTAVKLLGAVSVNSASISSATYTVQPTDVIINIDTSISGCVISLPSAATKRLLVIKDIGNNASAAGKSIQISPFAGEYVEFNSINTPYLIDRDGESLTLQSDGVNRWYII